LPQLHPNPNLKNPDPAVDLKIVVGATAQKHPVRNLLYRPGMAGRPRVNTLLRARSPAG
jgi:hypothetical protein